jgi:hypothetical protein
MVRTAFLTQQGTGALSITSTSAKLRTWKLELFEYNGGQCISTAFQGEMSNTDCQAVILIENMLEHFQILVEARCRCSWVWRWAPVEKKVCCTYQQRCDQGEMSNTDRQAAILIKFLPEHFQPLAEARRSCIDRQRCGLAEARD